MGTIGQVAVLNWALGHVPDICSLTAKNGFTCPYSRTHFNTSMVWGALGPRRFFADGTLYRGLLWFFLVGAILPIIVYAMKKAWPKQRWLEEIHVPLFLGGLNYIPPASGTNYGSWVIVGLVFGLWIKRNSRGWWRRYNFVLSSALDCATAIAGIIIFFAIFYTGASDKFSWWGTTVYQVSYIAAIDEFEHQLMAFNRILATGTAVHIRQFKRDRLSDHSEELIAIVENEFERFFS
jgi:hypothetical protein